MNKQQVKEEDKVKYTNLEELSYFDVGDEYVAIYINNEYEGDIKVWKDSEMDGREYVCINYEIIYLDTLRER